MVTAQHIAGLCECSVRESSDALSRLARVMTCPRQGQGIHHMTIFKATLMRTRTRMPLPSLPLPAVGIGVPMPTLPVPASIASGSLRAACHRPHLFVVDRVHALF